APRARAAPGRSPRGRSRPPEDTRSASSRRRLPLDEVEHEGDELLEAVLGERALVHALQVPDEPRLAAGVEEGDPVRLLVAAQLGDLPQACVEGRDEPLVERRDLVAERRDDRVAHAQTGTPRSSRSASMSGSISTTEPLGSASCGVFSPVPVTRRTTRSDSPRSPRRTASRRAPRATPVAPSPKMPPVSASSEMFRPISSSGTAYTAPPDARAVAIARSPSAGLPIAIDDAIERGRTGITARSSANAVATGAQPAACAPNRRGRSPVLSPRRSSCWKPCQIFVNIAPEPIGTNTASGVSQPSCSQISKASVFEPSA